MGRTWVGDGTYCYPPPNSSHNSHNQSFKFTEVCRRHCSYDLDYLKMDISIQSVLMLLSVGGNCFLLSLFITKRRQITRSSIFICNLCCADLFVALFVTLSSGIEKLVLRFAAHELLCKLLKLLLVAPLYSSAFSILAMGIDRYLAVFYPLLNYRWRMRQWLTIIGVVWLLSFLFASPQLAFFAVVDVQDCHVRRCIEVYDRYPSAVLTLYITWFCIVSYFIPAIALLAIYSLICRKIWNRYKIEDHQSIDTIHASEGSKVQQLRRSLIKHCSQPQVTAHVNVNVNVSVSVSEETTRELALGLETARSISKAHADEYRALATRAKLRVLLMTAVIVAIFVLFNAPYASSMIWLTLVDTDAPIARTPLFMICTTLANANSSLNSWIFMCFNRQAMCSRAAASADAASFVRRSSDHSRAAQAQSQASARRRTRQSPLLTPTQAQEPTATVTPTDDAEQVASTL